jgi:hypothetical protein
MREVARTGVLPAQDIPSYLGQLRFDPIYHYGLSTGFFTCSEKGKPYVLVKSVLAAFFIWRRGKVIWRDILDSQDQCP